MNNKAKASIIFVILLLIISLGTAGFYFLSYENEKKEHKIAQEQLNILKEEKNKIQAKLDELNKEKINLEVKFKENEKIIFQLNDKLMSEVKEKDLLAKEQSVLKTKASEVENEKNIIENTLNEKIKELAKLQSSLDALILEKNELERMTTQADSLNEVSESPQDPENLDKIIVTAKPALSAKVLFVNREYGFIVLNVGKSNAVEVGDVFEVFHQGQPIGSVQVEKIHETMSAANLLEDFKKDLVSESDLANRIN